MVTKLIYPSDLTEDKWQKIKYLLPKDPNTGRPRSHGLREILSLPRFGGHSGCGYGELV